MKRKQATKESIDWDNCRMFGHAWVKAEIPIERKHGLAGIYTTCLGCGTLRLTWLNLRSGTIYGRKYTYTEGYLLPKDERMTRAERMIKTLL